MQVVHCQEPAPTLTPQDDFLDVLNLLRDRQTYGIVIVENNVPVGLLTHSDMTAFFRATSEVQILVENIELILRGYIETAFPDEASRNQAIILSLGTDRHDPTRPSRSYEYLGFMDELKLMTDPDNWDKFQGVLEPKDLFYNLMNQVRVTRNQLAHFRGRPDAVQYDGVRTAMDWLETRSKLVTPEVAETNRDAISNQGGQEKTESLGA
ncbi:CBS domain-containing protein [Anaerolineae bacterium CFX7]|nr:CBS domain-containing protein [Anaerolineae bacterium CFX7]